MATLTGAGPFAPTPGIAGYAELPVSGAVGRAVFEVMKADAFSLESAILPIYVAYFSATPGAVVANGTFAPINFNVFASLSDPVPRFVDRFQLVSAFQIAPCP